MRRKNKTFIIDSGILVDNLVIYRVLTKDLYLIKIDTENRLVVDYYTSIQNNEKFFLKALEDDYIVIDKYGTLYDIIMEIQKA